MNRISRRALLALAAIAGVCAPALAEEWAPTRTVRIVVPIVGGTNDVVGRLVAPELQKALGQTVIFENKGGAGGNIGANEVARSPADGHTLLVGFNGLAGLRRSLVHHRHDADGARRAADHVRVAGQRLSPRLLTDPSPDVERATSGRPQ